MKLDFKVCNCLCEMETFQINGIEARHEDFGSKHDESRRTAEPYGCGNMTFRSKHATSDILAKYKITLEEYIEICVKLEEGLSFGACGWCS